MIATDPDVIDADQIYGVVEMALHRLQRRRVRPEKDPHPGDPDDAAGVRAGPGLVVGDVARVVPHRSHTRMAVHHRLVRHPTQIETGPSAAVRSIRDHAHRIHLGDDGLAPRCQSAVVHVQASAARAVGVVVGREQGSHAETRQSREVVEVVVERMRILQIEHHRDPAGGRDAIDIVDTGDQFETGMVLDG